MAELIRISVDMLLQSRVAINPAERKRRALSVIGQYQGGTSDLSSEHDRYLDEAYSS